MPAKIHSLRDHTSQRRKCEPAKGTQKTSRRKNKSIRKGRQHKKQIEGDEPKRNNSVRGIEMRAEKRKVTKMKVGKKKSKKDHFLAENDREEIKENY